MKKLNSIAELKAAVKEFKPVLDLRENHTDAIPDKRDILVCGGTGCTSSDSLQIIENLKEEIEKADILVNGTLVGMKPHEDRSPITDKSVFRSDLIVCDVVYNPEETKLLREAKEAGCAKTIGGKGMLLWQGVAAYKLYTGLDMPVEEYKKYQAENQK